MVNEIGGYADWPAFVAARPRVAGDEWTVRVGRALGVPAPLDPPEPRPVRSWTVTEGVVVVRTTELAWPVGFGPELHAWLLHPDGTDPRTLPGLLALHSHGGVKSVGALRMVLADGAAPQRRVPAYGHGAAFATRAAARGLTVLAPDAFSWGSRRFTLDPVPDRLAAYDDLLDRAGEPAETRYDALAAMHEHLVAKFAGVLATSYAGMVAHDDLSSLTVLRRRCAPDRPVSVAGFSGGGGRTATLSALAPVDRAVVAGMMATGASLVPDHVATHSWLLHTPGTAPGLDLPVLAANRCAHALTVVYAARDPLFPLAGMQAADARLRDLFEGARGSYEGVVVDTGHEFPAATQDIVLDRVLA